MFIIYKDIASKCVFSEFLLLFFHFPPQFGSCRSVREFEKLNRIGEGTYGIVCKFESCCEL